MDTATLDPQEIDADEPEEPAGGAPEGWASIKDRYATQRIEVRHTVVLEKVFRRRANDKAVRGDMEHLKAHVLKGGRAGKGWAVEVDTDLTKPQVIVEGETETYAYKMVAQITCIPPRMRTSLDTEFEQIVLVIRSAMAAGRKRWAVIEVDETPYDANSAPAIVRSQDADQYVGYAPCEVPDNALDYYSHIFEREAHINILLRALRLAVQTDWKMREHVVFVGPPACGKTELALATRRMLGNEAVMVYDGTATTMAGAIADLGQRDPLPRVLIVEEIEKAEETSLRWLLGLMDDRGEIRKITARQNVVRDTRVFCIATVNDHDHFNTMLKGALSSRFKNPLYCPRPDRDLMYRILEREVLSIGGNLAWIEPTLAYMEEIQDSDPRRARAICLCGQDALLDGSYQRDLRHVRSIQRVVTA